MMLHKVRGYIIQFVTLDHMTKIISDVPWSLYWKELYEANGPETKVILTVRDSTEKWWTSFDKFFTKAVMETDTCGFNSRLAFERLR